MRRACTVVQARMQNTAETSLERPCGCYAKATLRSLDASEIEAYRATGYFNDSARAKALGAIDSCKLQRRSERAGPSPRANSSPRPQDEVVGRG